MTKLGPTQPSEPSGRVAGLLIAAMRESPVSTLALCVLACAVEKPGASVRHVADRIGVSSAAISRVLPQLLEAGLLARLDDPDDRRMVLLLPLEPGTRLLKELHVTAVA
jgi:DNA-binding MarR family transcriptional regulator